LSKFDYAYSTPGRIGDWTQQRGTEPAAAYKLEYDNADQLREATLRDVATQAVVKHYAYAYDAAGNRKTEQIDNLIATEVPNQLNQLITRKAGGQLRVRGALTEPAATEPSDRISPSMRPLPLQIAQKTVGGLSEIGGEHPSLPLRPLFQGDELVLSRIESLNGVDRMNFPDGTSRKT
jgi:YD repeat-containing protein